MSDYITPVMYVDPSGYYVEFNLNELQKKVKIILGLIEDVSNFNMSNDHEGIVLDSNYFSFYKGNLVIRHSLPGSSCALFDIIILNRNETRNSQKLKEPELLMIITGGEMAYTREDGIKIVPIGCLKH